MDVADGADGWSEAVADVVVIGGGGSGLAAALRAAQLGGSVVVLEKGERPGGSTARSIGSISAAGSPQQQAAGVEDHPDWHFEDMPKFAPDRQHLDNVALRRLLVDSGADTIEWLQSIGLRFLGPMAEPPHRVPRMLNVLPNSRAYPHYLAKACIKAGVKIMTRSPAIRLIRQGVAIVGVEHATSDGGTRRIRATKGIVLAAGDFSGSEQLKAEHLGEGAWRVPPITETNTGDAIQMGIAVGGTVLNGQFAAGPQLRFVAKPKGLLLERLPPSRLLAAIMRVAWRLLPDRLLRPFIMGFATTNLAPRKQLFADGARLVTRDGKILDGQSSDVCLDVLASEGSEAYIVLDAELAERYEVDPNYVSTAPGLAYAYLGDYRRSRRDVYHRAGSLAELSQKLGVPLHALVEAYPALLSSNGSGRVPVGPFTALGPVKPWIVITDGGLRIDTEFRVLNNTDQVVPGLYAVGSAGQGGVVLEGHGHHLGWAFTSGRLCGDLIMSSRPQPVGL